MARELIQRDVEGDAYTISEFNTTKSLGILFDLVKIVGEPLAMAIGGSAITDSEAQAALMGKAVGALVARANKAEVISLIKQILECCMREGESAKDKGAKINFELDFQGARLGHLFKLLKVILEVQYSDFLGEVLSLAGTLKKASPATKKAHNSTGESGGLSSVA